MVPLSGATPSEPTFASPVRPLGVYQLAGLARIEPAHFNWFATPIFQSSAAAADWQMPLIALDPVRGHLLLLNPPHDHSQILNPYHAKYFLDARGLCLESATLWFCRDNCVYICKLPDLVPQEFTILPYDVHGVAVEGSTVYVTCQKSGYIHLFDRTTARPLGKLPAPGIGEENLTLSRDHLWVCDRLEQSVYSLDKTTGQLQFTVLTPLDSPVALTHSGDQLYLAYSGEEPYVRENPNNEDEPLELLMRDRISIAPLLVHHDAAAHYALSNGYLLEMSYLEELSPLDQLELENLEWRIALPAHTDRQRVCQVEPLGLPFEEELQGDQRVALFKFPRLQAEESRLFGWKARLEVRGIKYLLTPADVENCPPLPVEFAQKYLVDNDELAMDQPIVQAAAREAIGTETNILRKVLKIRNYVYDRLSYALRPRIDTPDVVLERGVGSCGEYVGVLLALARLNGIACRTVGRYKCPPYPERRGVPLQPDYNHVWLEFYVPGYGWLPMESNPDDVVERGPYPTRFFMGLPWYHVEMAKGIKFETTNYRDQGIRLGDLALNHVRFTILDELPAIG